jgi:hypothetical protein
LYSSLSLLPRSGWRSWVYLLLLLHANNLPLLLCFCILCTSNSFSSSCCPLLYRWFCDLPALLLQLLLLLPPPQLLLLLVCTPKHCFDTRPVHSGLYSMRWLLPFQQPPKPV